MNKEKRHVLFTFDYELFLGAKSGTVDECLIIPTNQLLKILSRYSVKAIFFVDTTYLIRLQEVRDLHPGAQVDWFKIIDQLKYILSLGHEVFPHLHPHWLSAKYNKENNEWDLSDFSKYRFNSISSQEKDLLWEESNKILRKIVGTQDPHYKFDSYRAGGWSIQPFSDFKPYFMQYGIRNEFSVRPGYKQWSTAYQFDFIKAPEKDIYSFEDDIIIEDSEGNYTEFTVSSIRKPEGIFKVMDKISNRLLLGLGLKGYGNGVTVDPKEVRSEARDQHFEKLEMASVEHLTLAKLPRYCQFLSQNRYMQFLSHPKSISKYHLFCLYLFLRYARAKYFLNSDFRKIDLR